MQPLLAAFILPWFGGTPAVWTACLLFFQGTLLLGYAWAHLVRRRVGWHLALVAISLISLPITPDIAWQPHPGDEPVLRVLGLLAASVGLPFLALAATAPLLQARAAAVGHTRVHRLYAASNAGSLLGLLVFPLWFQPFVGAVRQTWIWSAGYVVGGLVLAITLWPGRRAVVPEASAAEKGSESGGLPRLSAADADPVARSLWRLRTACDPPLAGRELRSATARSDATAGPAPQPGDRAFWVGFSAIGCTLLLAVTEAMSQDLSVTPLLWILPLGLYLLSFIVAFGAERWVSRRLFGPLFAAALAGMVVLMHVGYRAHWSLQLGGWCGALFIACTLCHGELVRRRPGPGHLTGFYLWISAGGALGGLLVGVVAPWLFSFNLELHLAVLAGWLLWLLALGRDPSPVARQSEPVKEPAPAAERRGNPPDSLPFSDAVDDVAPREGRRLLRVVLTLALVLGLAAHVWQRARGAELFRSFFGMLQVKTYPLGDTGRTLVHLLDGRISHGFQFTDEARRRRPTAYFAEGTGVGRLLARPGPPRHIGIVGLGAGTLAAYGRPGDRLRFYEINPDVVVVAQRHFTWLADSAASISVVEGDGRLSIQRENPNGFDVLVLDAFSGDAIPTHLLTTEALALYRQHLTPEGLLAVNVSNRHADLTRVVRALAQEVGLAWAFVRHEAASPLGPYRSDWMILAPRPQQLDFLGDSRRAPPDEPPVLWTDDFAPLLPLLTR